MMLYTLPCWRDPSTEATLFLSSTSITLHVIIGKSVIYSYTAKISKAAWSEFLQHYCISINSLKRFSERLRRTSFHFHYVKSNVKGFVVRWSLYCQTVNMTHISASWKTNTWVDYRLTAPIDVSDDKEGDIMMNHHPIPMNICKLQPICTMQLQTLTHTATHTYTHLYIHEVNSWQVILIGCLLTGPAAVRRVACGAWNLTMTIDCVIIAREMSVGCAIVHGMSSRGAVLLLSLLKTALLHRLRQVWGNTVC